MASPDNLPLETLPAPAQPSQPPPLPAIAPAWHTVVLVAGVLALSVSSASRLASAHNEPHRLASYAMTGGMELVLLLWVLLGLWLRRMPLRTVLGSNPIDLKSILLDLGIASVFWMGSMMVLGTLGATWALTERVIEHKPIFDKSGQPLPPDPSQQRTLETLGRLAPSNGEEIAAWALLCVAVGFIEEAVFRGYLQRQFIAWARGKAAIGVAGSAIVFGLGHGYEGVRSMFLIGVFGALFGVLALYRRGLRPGMIAHGWHDLIVGLSLALLKSMHRI